VYAVRHCRVYQAGYATSNDLVNVVSCDVNVDRQHKITLNPRPGRQGIIAAATRSLITACPCYTRGANQCATSLTLGYRNHGEATNHTRLQLHRKIDPADLSHCNCPHQHTSRHGRRGRRAGQGSRGESQGRQPWQRSGPGGAW